MSAQSLDEPAIPSDVLSVAPSVSAVVSSADCRVVIVERGFDPISHEAYLQWLVRPHESEKQATVVTTVPLAELSSGMWRIYDPKFINPHTITLAACFRFLDRRHEVTITLTDSGHYILHGDLTVRADEL